MDEYKERVAFLIVICAVILPLILMPNSLIMYGVFLGLFIIIQMLMLFLFYKEEELNNETWLGLWTVILGLAYLLILLSLGRMVWVEALGMLLLIYYLIVFIYMAFGEKIKLFFNRAKSSAGERKQRKKQRRIDTQLVRDKDELNDLIHSFRESVDKHKEESDESDSPVSDYFKKDYPESYFSENDFSESDDIEDNSSEDSSSEDDYPELDYDFDELSARQEKEDFFTEEPDPTTPLFEIGEPPEPIIKKEEPRIIELNETPKIDIEKMKKEIAEIDEGVKTITDKIKVIGEKAIAQGKKKKIEASKKNKIEKKDNRVFASKKGTKYHYDKACVSLKRVSKKDIIAYDDGRSASRQGLTACGMCKK